MKINTPELDQFIAEDKILPLSESQVLELQRLLAILGYYKGALDGLSGPQTRRAVTYSQSGASSTISPNYLRGLRLRASLLGGPYPYDIATKEGARRAIIAECKQQGFSLQQTAYTLATALWETNRTLQPVREAYWLQDPDAYLKKHHPNYYPYYGRGFVQLTWRANYEYYGELLGQPLLANPDLALKPEIAVFILVHGIKTGAFTGKKISDYINSDKCDFINARLCINGRGKDGKPDKADEVADLARKQYYLLLKEQKV